MIHRSARTLAGPLPLILALALAAIPLAARAQDRLPGYPGYDQYQRMSGQLRGAVVEGAVDPTWADDGQSFSYAAGGKLYRYDLITRAKTDLGPAPENAGGGAGGRRGGRGRGARAGGGGRGGRGGGEFLRGGSTMPAPQTDHSNQQQAASPDGHLIGHSENGNFHISDTVGGADVAVTSDGDLAKGLRYGIATITYGEELGMGKGIFWSADSKKVAYYGFDEGASKVQDYHILMNQTEQYDNEEIDPYPKAGQRSPVVNLYVYDVASKKSVQIDVRDGKPFADATVGYYVYRIYWSIDGKELLFSRMNRKQDTLEFVAANPETGKCRVILREEWPSGWVEFRPMIRFLEDGKRFILASERSGFLHYYLYDMSGKKLAQLTHGDYEAGAILRIDEAAGLMYYMARDGENHMKQQLHRVKMDGTGDVRLTDPKFNHTIDLSPDAKWFIDVAQTHDTPPTSRLMDSAGKSLTDLAKSDLTHFNELGFKKVEMFSYKAGDGKTEMHGMLHFPSNFDPAKKYPMLLTVYGGPLSPSPGPRETFTLPSATTEYGFLVVECEARSYGGRGKALLDAFHGHLGIVEMDDIAAGVKSLFSRPYVDAKHVGVYGTSYGGTSAATLLMRFPDVFAAASSSSPVTDYRNYNHIYGERYNGLVSENKAGFDAATVMTYAADLKGDLLLYYGTSDTNVHNSNSMQLISALQAARKHFEVQVGPDRGHTGVDNGRMMEFFIEKLVLQPDPRVKAPAAN